MKKDDSFRKKMMFLACDLISLFGFQIQKSCITFQTSEYKLHKYFNNRFSYSFGYLQPLQFLELQHIKLDRTNEELKKINTSAYIHMFKYIKIFCIETDLRAFVPEQKYKILADFHGKNEHMYNHLLLFINLFFHCLLIFVLPNFLVSCEFFYLFRLSCFEFVLVVSSFIQVFHN